MMMAVGKKGFFGTRAWGVQEKNLNGEKFSLRFIFSKASF
jgi:hypothetical protein